jgi:hypothetical protein
LKSWIDPRETSTFSENVSEICFGGEDIDVLAPGLEDSRIAWADAGAATRTTIAMASVEAPAICASRRRELANTRMKL